MKERGKKESRHGVELEKRQTEKDLAAPFWEKNRPTEKRKRDQEGQREKFGP